MADQTLSLIYPDSLTTPTLDLYPMSGGAALSGGTALALTIDANNPHRWNHTRAGVTTAGWYIAILKEGGVASNNDYLVKLANATATYWLGYAATLAPLAAILDGLAIVGSEMTLTAAERNAIADAHWGRVNAIAGNTTPAEALRRIGASAAGRVSGAGTGTEVFRDFAGVLCLTVLCDDAGNRTSVVYA